MWQRREILQTYAWYKRIDTDKVVLHQHVGLSRSLVNSFLVQLYMQFLFGYPFTKSSELVNKGVYM